MRTPAQGEQRLLLSLWALVLLVACTVGPLWAAGTFVWPGFGLYLGVLAAGLTIHRVYVARHNPELLARRRRIGAGTKPWDVIWNLAFWPLMIAIPVVAGLGLRFGWTMMPAELRSVGIVLLAGGLALSGWAMSVNPHFEGTVRIQTEIEHRVIDSGPYRALRHPGYAGLILWAWATPFMLLSWAALAPAGVVVGWIVLRTALEDRLLRRELAGYSAYCTRTRYRLLPGVW